jgi:hypothetical protein
LKIGCLQELHRSLAFQIMSGSEQHRAFRPSSSHKPRATSAIRRASMYGILCWYRRNTISFSSISIRMQGSVSRMHYCPLPRVDGNSAQLVYYDDFTCRLNLLYSRFGYTSLPLRLLEQWGERNLILFFLLPLSGIPGIGRFRFTISY